MKLVKSSLCLLASLVTLSAGGIARSEGAAPLDADNLSEAAGLVYENDRIVAAEMSECREKRPEQANAFRMADYVWHGENFDVLQVADKMIIGSVARVVPAEQAALLTLVQSGVTGAALAIKLNPEICMSLVNSMFSGSQNVKATTPKAYAYLKGVYSRNPDLVAKKQRNDFEVGCVKGYWNKGYRDFGKGHAFCQCTTKLVYSALTESDRRQMFAHARRQVSAQDAAWVSKLRAKSQPCAAILQSSVVPGSAAHGKR